MNPVAPEAESTALSAQTTTNSSARHLTRTITENLTTEETNPLGRLAQLGWGVKDTADATEFSVSNKALPDMEESSKYFLALRNRAGCSFSRYQVLRGCT